MAKAVFISNPESIYKDRPGEWYHFPNRQYLSRVAQTVADWVIFYRSRSGGAPGYHAVQKVESIRPDPADPTHSYAMLDRASELSFERTVPHKRPTGLPYESTLPASGGANVSAVRLISDADFAAIIDEGLREEANPDALPRTGPLAELAGFAMPPQAAFIPQAAEDRAKVLSLRAFRDQTFARQVKSAYAGRCAMSGLELRNGDGRPEVEAAHIIPVEERGPDTVLNGIALSGTVHWMFDRGLVAVDEDLSLMIAGDTVATDIAARLFVPDRRLILPSDRSKAPHTSYLKWHRENRFKG